METRSYFIKFNWLGKFLNGNEIVTVDTNAICITGKNGKKEIPVLQIEDLLLVKNRPWGATLVVESAGSKALIRFLKDIQLEAFVNEINKSIESSLSNRVLAAYEFFDKSCIQNYVRDSQVFQLDDVIGKLVSTHSKFSNSWNRFLSKEQQEQLTDLRSNFPFVLSIDKLRNTYEKNALKVRESFFNNVESNPLTEEQRLSVIRNNDRNLVLAAAGTGKTSVMVAKALDLVNRGVAKPEEILLLAYNKSAANELSERFINRSQQLSMSNLSIPKTTTFHALGLSIIRDNKVSASLSKFAEDSVLLNRWVSAWTGNYISENHQRLTNFITLMYVPVNPFDFQSKAEYERYVRDNEFRTLKGESVRGYQELLIANFFYLNGVEYEYEPQYIKKRRVEIGFDYRPDFYLPDADVYLEHFGISRDGSTRADIDSIAYNESITNKRLLHIEHDTILIETYHYDWVEENLEHRLAELLSSHNVKLTPISSDEILKVLQEFGFITKAAERFLKALQAIRVERLDKEAIKQRLGQAKAPHPDINAEFLADLLEAYKAELNKDGEIDFDDMIIKAVTEVEQGRYQHKWRHILVDEFQDISASRWALIKELIKVGPQTILTAVGDDWQSIYRFSGGKLALITEFESAIGTFTKTTLQKTFRYNSSIAETAGTFIMENSAQYKKQIHANQIAEQPQVYLLDSNTQESKEYSKLTKRCLEVIQKIRANDKKGTIAVIARYNYLLSDAKSLITQYYDRDICYWTFHRSKGLEADYCILIGLFRGRSGFPNESVDDVVVEALLPMLDSFRHSEERRLMYVGLTRAKHKTYLIADPHAPSEFVDEMLSQKYNLHVGSESFTANIRDIYKCPSCAEGHLRLLSGNYGDFYVCTSERACKIRPRVCEKCSSPVIDDIGQSKCRNPRCGHEFKICKKCARPMRLRAGKYGQFYGCSGFGIKDDQCDHTEKLQ